MDAGRIFETEFRVIPGLHGSFIVSEALRESGTLHRLQWGFSNIDDLISWFQQNARAFKTTTTSEKKQG